MAKFDASTMTETNAPRALGLTLAPGDYLVWDEVAPLPAGMSEPEVSEMERHLIRRGLRTFTHEAGLVVVHFDHDFSEEPTIKD